MLPFIVAKGWEPEYPLKVAQKVAKEIVDETKVLKHRHQTEETQEHMLNKVAHIEDLVKWLKKAGGHKLAVKHAVLGNGESAVPYQALAGDESVQGLKQQIAFLKAELGKTKTTRDQEQKVLADTQDQMMGVMKQMNATVTRIESARPADENGSSLHRSLAATVIVERAPMVEYIQQPQMVEYIQQPQMVEYIQQAPVEYIQQAPVEYVTMAQPGLGQPVTYMGGTQPMMTMAQPMTIGSQPMTYIQ